MSARFTPGPWFFEHRQTPKREGYYTDVFTADGGSGLGRIASFDWYPKPKDESGAIGTYREANARLCAAAPELYEALMLASKMLRTLGVESDVVSKALTKARGEAS